MKKILIFIMLIAFGCKNNPNKINKKSNETNCKRLNDSALVEYNLHHYNKALELIDKAIECDSTEIVYLSNKLSFLQKSGMYRECIEFIDKNNSYFSEVEVLSGKAICYYYLKDTANYNLYKEKALKQAQRQFEENKNEYNLINYLTIIRMYDEKNGEQRAMEVFDSNKEFFTSPGMDTIMIEVLEKTPTFQFRSFNN